MSDLSKKTALLTQFANPLSLRKLLDLSLNRLKHMKLCEDIASQISGAFINTHLHTKQMHY